MPNTGFDLCFCSRVPTLFEHKMTFRALAVRLLSHRVAAAAGSWVMWSSQLIKFLCDRMGREGLDKTLKSDDMGVHGAAA